MLGQRRRRWANSKPVFVDCPSLADIYVDRNPLIHS